MTRKDILYLERGTMPSRLENEVYFLTWSERGVSAEKYALLSCFLIRLVSYAASFNQ